MAAFAAKAAGRIRQSGRALVWLNRALGAMFIGLGVRVAMMQNR
jgi:threonine/homoserine/homoserine lactone efflux protein